MNNSNIQKNVMRRVRTIRVLRSILNAQVASFVLAALALYEIGREVFVAQVIANMPSFTDIAAVTLFAQSAVMNTTFLVQLSIGVCVIAFAWFVADGLKNLKNTKLFA